MSEQIQYFAQWESPELIDDILHARLRAAEDPRWQLSGARTAAEYEFWSWRACGIACLRMVLAARSVTPPTAVELGMELLAAGAYTLRDGGLDGLIYSPFVQYLNARWSIPAQVRPDLPIAELYDCVAAGSLVMASVHGSIRNAPVEPPRRGGHLVLVHGVDGDAVVFHNPSGTSPATRESVRQPCGDFARYFAGRGVVLPAWRLDSGDLCRGC